MREVTWTDLKKMLLEDVVKGQCLRVTGNMEMAFYVVIKPQEAMRQRVEAICSQIDAGKGMS